MIKTYDQTVTTRYHIYNSLFLNLRFRNVYKTGTLLPLLQQACEEGFQTEKDSVFILDTFFDDFIPGSNQDEQFELLFNFIQYIERQIVLFDSVEDAVFAEVNDLEGSGSVKALLLRAKGEDKVNALKTILDEFSVRIVLTAHPTQFYPGSVLAIINDLGMMIKEDRLDDINALLNQLGKTPIINREKPTPYEEAVSLCWYLENVFYYVVPDILLQLINGLQIPIEEWDNYDIVKIGFWPGGDRDGNPFVTSDITLEVAAHLNRTVMKCYHRDLRLLKRRLTFQGVVSIISVAESKVYNAAYGQGQNEQYKDVEEFLDDLLRAKEILVKEHDGLFLHMLDLVIVKARVFGFYFASMDIRQDSRKHISIWESISNTTGMTEEEQVNTLLGINQQINPTQFRDAFQQDLVNSISAIAAIQKKYGPESCHRYVISNTRSTLDIIRVFALANQLIAIDGLLSLDIVPLFESIDDLDSAPAIMDTLYGLPAYRNHLESRDNKQTIMLGFSDGTKDGGYLRANWSIYQAKENLSRVSRQHGLKGIFFDGRGGPPGRGGGNTHDFYASLGDLIDSREIQITIQGQTISSNFGKPVSCRYNLEQLLSAGMENEIFDKKSHLEDEESELLEQLADEAHKAYLELKNHPKFVPYLDEVTPLSFFSETNIGSRPMKRGQSDKLEFEDLRAIPFVGSWAQMKQNIPGFYGVGSALARLKQSGRMEEVKTLYKNSLLFKTLLSNSMMSLTKSFFPATAYLQKDKDYAEFWALLHDEFVLSRQMILEVSDLPELMASNPSNRDSVMLREKIVLPLITIQQYALQQLRKVDDKNTALEEMYKKLIIRCMSGIINAARNSA